MLPKSFQSRQYTIRAYTTTDSEVMSFDTCFEINRYDILPRSFKTRNGRTFTKIKLKQYKSVVDRIQCEGHVTFADLKRHMPTIFDPKIIRSLNSQSYLRENIDQIIVLGSAIIGEETTRRIIGNRHKFK